MTTTAPSRRSREHVHRFTVETAAAARQRWERDGATHVLQARCRCGDARVLSPYSRSEQLAGEETKHWTWNGRLRAKAVKGA